MAMIIGVHGGFGVGKTEVAEYLERHHSFTMLNFGDALKKEVFNLFLEPNPHIPLYAPTRVFSAYRELAEDPGAVYRKPTSLVARIVLQWHGTDYRRKRDPEYWIRPINEIFERCPYTNFVVGDVRFRNEIEMISANGGQVWHLNRPGEQYTRYKDDVKNHESESDLSELCNQHIKNDSTLLRLYQRVDAALAKCLGSALTSQE